MIELSIAKLFVQVPWLKKVWAGCNVLYSVACMTVIPLAVIVPISWLSQRPAITGVTATDGGPRVAASPGQDLYLDRPVRIDTETRVVVYRMWLEQDGRTVYQYPSVSKEDQHALSFGGELVEVPRSLRPGTYTLVVEARYALNPLKTAVTRVEVAKLDVR